MNLDISEHIPADFHDESRVWIYQSNRLFTISEAFRIEEILNEFLASWNAHGAPVKGYANLFFGQFIVIMADEKATVVSGCSTDSSVRIMKAIEQEMKVSLFDRQLLAFVVKDRIQMLPLKQLHYAFDNNFINTDTLYFNNLAAHKKDLLNNWIIPMKDSWLSKRLKLAITA